MTKSCCHTPLRGTGKALWLAAALDARAGSRMINSSEGECAPLRSTYQNGSPIPCRSSRVAGMPNPPRASRISNPAPLTRMCPALPRWIGPGESSSRSEEHTSELQSPQNLVCRLLLEKKMMADTKNIKTNSEKLSEIKVRAYGNTAVATYKDAYFFFNRRAHPGHPTFSPPPCLSI